MTRTVIPYIVLAISIALVVCVWVFSGSVQQALEKRNTELSSAESEAMRQEVQLRVHSLARETVGERAELERLVSPDIVTIVEAIETAGRDAGVVISLGQAAAIPATDTPLNTITLGVEATGSFDAVMKAGALLASLPVPSILEQIQFEKREEGWGMSARLRFLTAADVPL